MTIQEPNREQVCRDTADALRRHGGAMHEVTVLLGFDGFVDEICQVVEHRSGPGRDDFTPVSNIARLAEKIAGASGQSSNYELVVRQERVGGNAPIMAGALARLGMDVTYIGAAGHPELHPAFSDLAREADVRGIAPPAHTDALEFSDGKLMIGKLQPLSQITWDTIRGRLGAETFEHLLARSRLVALVNWTMLPQMSRIWASLIQEVLPNLPESRHGRRMVFIDLADPEKRARDDLRYALRLLGAMQQFADVHLGLNLKEAVQACGALGFVVPADPAREAKSLATTLRDTLRISCCVVHPRTGAAAASAGEQGAFAGPFVREPQISTGAGDHFNAGFMLGRVLHLPLEQCLCAGVGTSGWFVRRARAPSLAELIEFITVLPDPETSD